MKLINQNILYRYNYSTCSSALLLVILIAAANEMAKSYYEYVSGRHNEKGKAHVAVRKKLLRFLYALWNPKNLLIRGFPGDCSGKT